MRGSWDGIEGWPSCYFLPIEEGPFRSGCPSTLSSRQQPRKGALFILSEVLQCFGPVVYYEQQLRAALGSVTAAGAADNCVTLSNNGTLFGSTARIVTAPMNHYHSQVCGNQDVVLTGTPLKLDCISQQEEVYLSSVSVPHCCYPSRPLGA